MHIYIYVCIYIYIYIVIRLFILSSRFHQSAVITPLSPICFHHAAFISLHHHGVSTLPRAESREAPRRWLQASRLGSTRTGCSRLQDAVGRT